MIKNWLKKNFDLKNSHEKKLGQKVFGIFGTKQFLDKKFKNAFTNYAWFMPNHP